MDEVEGYPLSVEQSRVWTPDPGERWVRATCAARTAIDPVALTRALATVCRRHEILRTRFVRLPAMRLPLQTIDPPGAAPVVRLVASAGPPSFASSEMIDCTLTDDGGLLTVAVPAVLADAFALCDLIAELDRALGTDEDGEPLQYVDYVQWQAELLAGDQAAASQAHWRLLATSLPAPSPSPLLRIGRNAGPDAGRGAVELGLEDAAALRAAAASAGHDLGSWLHAVFATLYSRLVGAPTTLTWHAYDGRTQELRGALGPFARSLPVVTQLADDGDFAALLQLLARTGEAHACHAIAFDPGAHPALQPSSSDAAWRFAYYDGRAGGLRLRRIEADDDAFALTLAVIYDGETVTVRLDFDRGRFAQTDMARVARMYGTLAGDLARRPEAPLATLHLLDPAERAKLLAHADATPADPRPIHARFAAAAAQQPDAPALLCDGDVRRFGEVARAASTLARRLSALGIGPEDVVGLCLPRGVGAIEALLGIWMSGAAYVPLDPELPAARLAFLLADAGARAVVVTRELAPRLELAGPRVVVDTDEPAIGPDAWTPPPVSGSGLAYVLYTSGSSGQPKGVMVTHGALANLAHALDHAIYDRLGDRRTVGLNAALAFDASVKQLIQLARGHTLHILPEAVRFDARALSVYLARHRIDVLDLTPTQLRLLLTGDALSDAQLPTLLVGGEAIDPALWRRLAALPRGAFNVYGPTECTVDATAAAITDDAEPTIGAALPNVRAYVLDRRREPVPTGITGELYLGGAGVARGYRGRPAATAARFLPDPFAGEPGARMYRTGDVVRRSDDGALVFVGRADLQVKLNGVRIELEEIERTLSAHPAVADAGVAVAGIGDDQRLIGYVAVQRAHAASAAGRPRHRLPNGLAIAHQNKNETDYLYRELFAERLYLRHGVRLPADGVIFDVGANIGMFALFARVHSPDACVLSFEPLAPLYDLLATNCALFGGQLRPFALGLSDRERSATFSFYRGYSMMSGLTDYADPRGELEVVKTFLRNQHARGDREAGDLLRHADELLAGRFAEEHHEVRLRRLSDVVREHRIDRIDLLKIDVQRAELDVLRGIDDADWPRIAQVVMEVHDGPGPTHGRVAALSRLLFERGFTVVAEQDPLLAGTDRHNLYAWRPSQPVRAADPSRAIDPTALAAILTPDDLRAFARERLPGSMVPAQWVVLDALPLTVSGKIDRRALPAPPPPTSAGDARDHVEPRNELERGIAAIWAEVLRIERVGVHDNFFDLGGHSLLLVQAHHKLTHTLGLEVSTMDLFRNATVAALAAFLSAPTDAEPLDDEPAARKQREAIKRQKARTASGREDT
jgi:amino acid adenylation domain-containing protein/FkbM family methyltransferase